MKNHHCFAIVFLCQILISIVTALNWDPNYDLDTNITDFENVSLIQGDIILSSDNINSSNDSSVQSNRASEKIVLKNKSFLWQRGVVIYQLHQSVQSISKYILQAMSEIEEATCIRFRERRQEKYYLLIYSGNGCFSAIGRRYQVQHLSLNAQECRGKVIAQHELLHALGFAHMHARFDRDQYIQIHWENIQHSMKSQFDMKPTQAFDTFTEFDFDSVMLYGPKTFSKDKKSITMSSKVPGRPILEPNQKSGLSRGDIISINQLYSCRY